MLYWTTLLRDVSLGEFGVLALLAAGQWFRHRVRGAGWAALAFAILGILSILSRVVTDVAPALFSNVWFDKVLIAVILLLPYCFYRFATSFGPRRLAIHLMAIAATFGVVLFTFLLRDLPFPGQPTPPDFAAYRVVVVSVWGLLVSYVVFSLWSAGTGQTRMSSNRMRLLAVAVAGLDLQVIVGALGWTGPSVTLASVAASVVMGIVFLIALALPSFLRIWWRQGEDARFRRAVREILAADSPAQVAAALLPRVCALVGGSYAALVDADNAVIAEYPSAGSVSSTPDGTAEDTLSVQTRFGPAHHLVVRINPYMPYFGREELQKLDELADTVGLAMERSMMAEQMAHQAHHDDLTGLPKRGLFLESLSGHLRFIGRRSDALAVMFIDLDKFKLINDQFEHEIGNKVLVETARRLTGVLREGDTVCRLGGDELVAFAPISGEAEALHLADRIGDALAHPMTIDGIELTVTASIGVVVTSDRDADPARLVADADKAMYLAKERGRNRVELFNDDTRPRSARPNTIGAGALLDPHLEAALGNLPTKSPPE